MQYYFVNDWTLLTGAKVHVLLDKSFLREGLVETCTPDGNIIWLQQGYGFGRQLVDKGSGFKIHISEAQLEAIGRLP